MTAISLQSSQILRYQRGRLLLILFWLQCICPIYAKIGTFVQAASSIIKMDMLIKEIT